MSKKPDIETYRNEEGVQVALFSDDRGPTERERHGRRRQVDIVERKPGTNGVEIRSVLRATDTTVLDRLYRRAELDPKDASKNELRYRAARRLEALFKECGIEGRITPTYEEPSGAGKITGIPERVLDRRREYVEALQSVGIIASRIIVEVICMGEECRPVAMGMGFKPTEGITLLRAGLQALVQHFGIVVVRDRGGPSIEVRR